MRKYTLLVEPEKAGGKIRKVKQICKNEKNCYSLILQFVNQCKLQIQFCCVLLFCKCRRLLLISETRIINITVLYAFNYVT